MPDYEQRLLALAQRIDDRWWMLEIALGAEHSVLSADAEKGRELLAKRTKETLESLLVAGLYQRRWGWEYEVRQSEIELAPPRGATWQQPLTLRFDWLAWSQATDAHVAFVPALGIEVLHARAEKLPAAVENEIRAALNRLGSTNPLEQFVRLERRHGLHVTEINVMLDLPTPKQVALRELDKSSEQTSVLKPIGVDFTRGTQPEAFELEGTVAQLAELLNSDVPRSVLLVGPPGVGKTAVVYQLVRERREHGLERTPFWATSGARLVAGMSGFGMWQERCRDVCREAAKKKAIVYLGNLVELAEVGRCISQSESIASFLRPYLMRGELTAIAECTPEQLTLIERDMPQLLPAFTTLKVAEPDRERGRRILEKQATASARDGGGRFDSAAIDMLDRLHRRYAGYSAYPGRPLRLLKNLCQDAPPGAVVSAADVTRAFSRETGLPLVLLDDQTPLDLVATERWFSERVRGQGEAVELVVGLLATVKAGLTRPGRPVASLLFIGPTGVGKTETSKALAEFLYQRPDRMVRFDMTEYADYAAVERLAGGAFGAQGLLTSRVREQPFTVVLFDEFEKAHPRFFDLLLQVLGEARLTDAAGRLADFSNAVVIMTSNLGAESFQRGMSGFGPSQATAEQARDHFVRHVRQFLRPELFNRIDRIVPFTLLNEQTISEIAQRELAAIPRRDGIAYAGVELDMTGDVPRHLAQRGYEPRYGARPLKRAIERQLLAPLAAGLNRYAGELARTGEVRLENGELKVDVRARLDRAGRQAPVGAAPSVADSAGRATALRRSLQSLKRCPDVLRLRNEVARLAMIEERWLRAQQASQNVAPPIELGRLAQLRRLLGELDRLTTAVVDLENHALMAVYTSDSSFPTKGSELSTLTAAWEKLLLDVYAERYLAANQVLVAVYGEHQRSTRELAHAYFALARRRGIQCELHVLKTHDPTRDFHKPGVCQIRRVVDEPPAAKETVIDALRADSDLFDWHAEEAGAIGVALVLRGRMAFPLFEPERGIHLIRHGALTFKCLVDIGDDRLDKYLPPPGIDRRGAIGGQLRRTYDMELETADDNRLGKRIQAPQRGFDNLVAFAVEQWLQRDAESLIEG